MKTFQLVRQFTYAVFRCYHCGFTDRYSATRHGKDCHISRQSAVRFATEDGWVSVKGKGWHCPNCAQKWLPEKEEH